MGTSSAVGSVVRGNLGLLSVGSLIIPKSGNTGLSIGVVVTHGNVIKNGVQSVADETNVVGGLTQPEYNRQDDEYDFEKLANVHNNSKDRGSQASAGLIIMNFRAVALVEINLDNAPESMLLVLLNDATGGQEDVDGNAMIVCKDNAPQTRPIDFNQGIVLVQHSVKKQSGIKTVATHNNLDVHLVGAHKKPEVEVVNQGSQTALILMPMDDNVMDPLAQSNDVKNNGVDSAPSLTHHILVVSTSMQVNGTGHVLDPPGRDGTDGTSMAEGPDMKSVEGSTSSILPAVIVIDEKMLVPIKVHKDVHGDEFTQPVVDVHDRAHAAKESSEKMGRIFDTSVLDTRDKSKVVTADGHIHLGSIGENTSRKDMGEALKEFKGTATKDGAHQLSDQLVVCDECFLQM